MVPNPHEMQQKGLEKRRQTRELATKEAKELYEQGTDVHEIARILGEKFKKNGKPYSVYTIYEYLGGVKKRQPLFKYVFFCRFHLTFQ